MGGAMSEAQEELLVEALTVLDNTLVPVTLLGVRYRVGREVVVGWYDQEHVDRVVAS